MVIARGDHVCSGAGETVNERDDGRDAHLALGRSKSASIWVGGFVFEEEVVLHVNHEQHVIRADLVDLVGRGAADELQELVEKRRLDG